MENNNNLKMKFCDKCSKEIPSKDYIKHCQRVHDKEPVVCPDCGKVLAGIGRYKAHMRLHETWKCDQCDTKMSIHSKSRHEKKCKGKAEEEPKVVVHSCEAPGCTYMTPKLSNLERQKVRKHAECICVECGLQFSKQALLKAHLKEAHGDGSPKQRFKCSYCGIYQSTSI